MTEVFMEPPVHYIWLPQWLTEKIKALQLAQFSGELVLEMQGGQVKGIREESTHANQEEAV